MEVNFELLAEPDCGIAIDSSSTEYVSDTDGSLLRTKGNFSKNYSVVLNVVSKDNSLDSSINNDTELDCDFIEHPEPTEITHHTFSKGDGIYKIEHFVIPNKAWLDNIYTDLVNLYSEAYETVIYSNNLKLYKYNANEEDTEITLEELLALVGEDVSFLYCSTSTLCTCGLHLCYFNLAKSILTLKDACDISAFQNLIYKRDMVWMGLNVIDYLLDLGDELAAAEILAKLESCNGVCSDLLNHKPFVDCGCGK